VIIKAFRFLNKLKERGYEDICVSINLSIIQFMQPDFTDKLFKLMEQMQITPKNICIEITKSVFASDSDSINEIIEELREAGITIAIDDFGTGYSSLSREKELKADSIKIDKYFIDKLLNTDPNKAITGDIISMAHRLGHDTIAEGVENYSQRQYLGEHGCDKIQGYLISRPLDEKDALRFLEKYKAHKTGDGLSVDSGASMALS
jgi:EAL domain-containing protein (putative c-di-GMP-specific phosphodiesterase class I)